MRLCIVRVAQQSTKHLDKILNVDEFMKRIYTVIHSNDPYARALTLRYDYFLKVFQIPNNFKLKFGCLKIKQLKFAYFRIFGFERPYANFL